MDTGHLVKARATLFEDNEGWCQKGQFVSLCCDMPPPNIPTVGMMDRLTLAVRSISLDEWNMLTALERLDWMRTQAGQSEHIKSRWRSYASTDIESWYFNFRSLLDQAALVICETAGIKSEKLEKSFRRLYNRASAEHLSRPEGTLFSRKLGPDWLTLLHTVTWLGQIVSVRDAVLHLGGHTIVFEGPSKGILFQVHGARYQNLVKSAALMFNPNVVYFDRYAAHLMSHLVIFLEDFSRIVYDRLTKSLKPDDTARGYHPGWGTLNSWIDSTLAAVAPRGP